MTRSDSHYLCEAGADAVLRHDEQLARAIRLLPAWFVPRMMEDTWTFGLLLTTGQTLVIRNIRDMHRDSANQVWIDVEMAPTGDLDLIADVWGKSLELVGAPTSRLTATVNAAHIVWAFELADT